MPSPIAQQWAVRRVVNACLLGVAFLVLAYRGTAEETITKPADRYEYRPGSREGLDKWYMGRNIANFMSHEGAPWLEREEREDEEAPSKLLDLLRLKPGNVVADVGAGSGYLSWRMAKLVLPGGSVYANDIQKEMLAILRTNTLAHGVTNVIPVLGTVEDVKLPEGKIDLAILVDVYHECDHPYEIVQAICRSLKPDGRLVFVEYRGEDPNVPIKLLHKMTEAQVRKEMATQPLAWVETLHDLPRQHVIIFRKREATANSTP